GEPGAAEHGGPVPGDHEPQRDVGRGAAGRGDLADDGARGGRRGRPADADGASDQGGRGDAGRGCAGGQPEGSVRRAGRRDLPQALPGGAREVRREPAEDDGIDGIRKSENRKKILTRRWRAIVGCPTPGGYSVMPRSRLVKSASNARPAFSTFSRAPSRRS